MTTPIAATQPLRCRIGLHKWVRLARRDLTLDQPGQHVETQTTCQLCGRERKSGGWVAAVLSVAVAAAGVVIFFLASPMLGAIVMVGAIGGLGWAMAPAILDRLLRWLGSGR